MRKIYRIARTELQTLFYSPIAWLILIVFTFQTCMVFVQEMEGYVRSQALGYGVYSVTSRLYASWTGVFSNVQNYLYLYMPLLTMGLMSRELSSGSIKLLYSSPVTSWQIIFGKYLAMVIYGLVLIGILCVMIIFNLFTIENMDYGLVFTGLLGIYLLICAYAAIGLFMSCLTSYQVVAAIGTLALLAALNFVGGMWQGIDLIRDITYWLSISGRADELIAGLICSEDVLYFVIVIAVFLGFSILKLQSGKQRTTWYMTLSKYVGVFLIAIFLGYLSSRPALKFFHDSTATKIKTLTKSSQDIMNKMTGDLTITTYVNLLEDNCWSGLPVSRNGDIGRFAQYIRFKPDIKMKYVYYYDRTYNHAALQQRYPGLSDEEIVEKLCETMNLNPKMFMKPEEFHKIIDLSDEYNRFIRVLERGSGEKTFLRVYEDNQKHPHEREISAAMKRLVMDLPKVGFVQGHGMRDIWKTGDLDYYNFAHNKIFRYSLLNQGFDVTALTLDQDVPEDVNVLVIAEMKTPFSDEELERLNRYVERGGNLLIAGDAERQEVMNPVVAPFGVKFLPGRLAQSGEHVANLIVGNVTRESCDLNYMFRDMFHVYTVTMPDAVALECDTTKGFTATPLLVTKNKGSWIEYKTTDFVDDKAELNPEDGEVEQANLTALALNRKVGDKDQKIIILGDADCISNGEISRQRSNIIASNYSFINAMFFWLSDNEVPIDVRRQPAKDNAVHVSMDGMSVVKVGFLGVLPILLLLCSVFIWVRRRGK